MHLRLIFCLLLCLSAGFSRPSPAVAQISLFDKVNDPLGIADLGGPDSLPPHHNSFVHGGYDLEDDGYRVFADLEGPGIVSHIWTTWRDGLLDTIGLIKVTVDDSLIYQGNISKFFLTSTGRLRSPLDTLQSGGLNCDVPMPFKKQFKMTFKGDFAFFTISWRGVVDGDMINSFRPWDTTGLAEQLRAENILYRSSQGGLPSSNQLLASELRITPSSVATILQDTGAGIVQMLQLRPKHFDTLSYRQLWLRCTWDGEPLPAIEVPVADLFASTTGIPEMNALQLKATAKDGFVCLLPMPFAHGSKIELVNRSASTIELSSLVSIDRTSHPARDLGRLHIQFNEVKQPRMHHYIPVAHAKGRGRFVGVIFNMPARPNPPYYLEGNPKFDLDSNRAHFMTYPGTEDYFNGGWYFIDGAFSLPFAGCPKLYSSVYRFHYLDFINFAHTLDLEWEHGSRNDYFEHYRTVAFLYMAPTPFWVLSDSVVRGERLTLGGAGVPGSSVDIELGDTHYEAAVNSEGRFLSQLSTSELSLGDHQLKVNGALYHKRISILDAPVVTYVIDSQYREPCFFDSLEVTVRAFKPNETIQFRLGTRDVGEIQPNSLGFGRATIRLSSIPPGAYILTAVQGEVIARCSDTVSITPTLRYEIEDLPPPLSDESPYIDSYVGWFYDGFWSNNKIRFIAPSQNGQGLTMPFDVPFSDTFACALSATQGIRYADMSVSIDGTYIGTLPGYRASSSWEPFVLPPQELSTIHLNAGRHLIRFAADGRDPNALEYALGPDLLLLTPRNPKSSVDAGHELSDLATIDYSHRSRSLHVSIRPSLEHELLKIRIVDVLGRMVCEVYSGPAARSISLPICQDLASGVYFATGIVRDQRLSCKFTVQ